MHHACMHEQGLMPSLLVRLLPVEWAASRETFPGGLLLIGVPSVVARPRRGLLNLLSMRCSEWLPLPLLMPTMS